MKPNALSPGLHFVEVHHDPDCPALTGGECHCQPDYHFVDQTTWLANHSKTRKQRREAEREAEKAVRRAAKG